MVMHVHDGKRDTLGRVFKTQNSPEFNDAHISGDRDSIRAGVAHRFDDRKGAELLNSKNMGRHDGPRGAPLDAMRMHRGDGVKVAADIFPLNHMNPVHRAEVTALFRNPAVTRAYLVNPDATTHIIGERHPELKTILEANAPFSLKDGVFSVNTKSPMYRSIRLAEDLHASAAATELYRDLDKLHTSVRGTALGGAAGIETITHTFLTACVRHGFQSEEVGHAAAGLQTMMKTVRAQEDLKIVASLGTQRPSVERVSIQNLPPVLPVHVPQTAQPTPQFRSQVTQETPFAAPSLPLQPLQTPAERRPQSDSLSAISFAAPLMSTSQQEVQSAPPRETAAPVQSIPQAQPSLTAVTKEPLPLMKSQEPTPAASIPMTPTMQRLVDVVNNSMLERQIGSPQNDPVLEFSDRDHNTLKKMLTNPTTKQELLGYSDEQLKAAFQAVRPDRITYLEEWLAMNHRDAMRHPGLAQSMAGITREDTNRIGQVVGIARSVANERAVP